MKLSFETVSKALGRSLVVAALSGVMAGTVPAVASDHGAEVNPTGNPLGGGAGYNRIVSRSSADYIVSTKSGLLSALSSATSGDIVYIEDSAKIDLTGSSSIGIAAGVTLASGRGRDGSEGGLLFTNQYTATVSPFLSPNGTGIRITGVRIFGPDFEVGDHHYGDSRDASPSGSYRSNVGIRTTKANLEVDNCELAGWVYAAVLVREGATGVKVHHNYIHHNRRSGVGYGVCVSNTSDSAAYASALIEANVFDYNRHHIAGHGTKYESYEARYNLCLEHDVEHCFDMHGHPTPTLAGSTIKIHHNTFRDTYVAAVSVRGVPLTAATINNNWIYHTAGDTEPIKQITPAGLMFTNAGFRNMQQTDNVFQTTSPNGVTYPTPVATASVTSGRAPLTVSFNGAGSVGSIQSYVWKFGDGKSALGETARGARASYTFTDPGVYNVELEVWDNKGLPARTFIPITVLPATDRNYLSFWMKDGYRGTETGYYEKQALINGSVVWRDDIAGNEEWQHVVIDVTDNAAVAAAVAAKSAITLAFRAYCKAQVTNAKTTEESDYKYREIQEILVYVDDVSLHGFDVKAGDMETEKTFNSSWTRYKAADWTNVFYNNWDPRSGYASALMYSYVTDHQPSAGTYAQISQVVSASGGSVPADTTAPAAVASVNDGTGTDTDVTATDTTLSANWPASSDAESGIAAYWYSVGTTAGGTNIVSWTSAGTATAITRTGLSLTNGTTYYVSVKAENGAGLQSTARTSDGICVAMPVQEICAAVAYVNDGTGADVDVTNSSYTLAVNWATSTSADITRYWYSCGYTPGEDDAISWKTVGLSTYVIRTNLTLVDGVTYYFNVKAENSDGLQSAVTSADGICALLKSTIDTTAPAVVASVNDGTGTDVDVTTSSTSLSANWTTSSDAESGIAEYWYCVGTTAGGTNSIGWTSAGTATAMTRTGLSLTNGATYYVSVKAENGAGLQSVVRTSDGMCVRLAAAADTTAPAAVGTVNDGTGTDTDSTTSASALSANWSASSDAESGIAEYWYAIGTSAGGTNILGWTSAGTATAITRTGLSLTNGVTYYVSVKAENGAGLQSSVRTSDGICVNLSASSPVIAYVNDGCGADADIVTSKTTLGANWAPSADSGFVIAAYWYSLGYTPGADDAISWKTVNLSTYVIRTNLTLVDGVTYYFNVRAVNAAGTQSAVTSSDGICARLSDTSTPSSDTPAAVAYVNDGFGADIDITTSEAVLGANWGSVSGAAKYWYSLGYTPGADDAISWKTVSLSTYVVRTNLVLKNGVMYYFNVKVENAAGVQSAVTSSDGVRAVLSDTTVPSTVATVNDGGTTDSDVTASNTTLSATWTAATDAESGIAAYWYSIGTAAGGTSVVGWTSVGTEMSMARTGLSLARGTTYYVNVKAENGIGLQSAVRSSDGVCVMPHDTTAPAAVAGVNDGTGTDLDVTASLTTIAANWQASSDVESGIAQYWYSIGTTAGGTDTAGWASAGTALAVTRTGLSLSDGKTYYVNVRAENGAGLQSAVTSSDGITVDAGDTTAPAAVAYVYDGTEADMAVSDSSTTLSATWGAAADAESGIARYWYCIGTTAGGANTLAWTSAGTATVVTRAGLSLVNGTTYFVSVKAENGAGLQSAVRSSDGICVVFMNTASVVPEETNGCIGRWKFDEGSGTAAADSSGKGKTGTLYNGVQWVAGKSGKAVKFDGSNDYVQIANADTLANVTDFTVDFWVNPAVWKTKENLAYNGLFKIYHRGDWAGGRVYFMVKINSTQASGDSSWAGWAAVRSVQELAAGTWYHLTCVKSGNNLVLYINGIKDREIAALSGFSVSKSGLTDLSIGGYATFFNGSIDDFSICSTALSGAAVYSAINKEDPAAKTAGFAAGNGGTVADAFGNQITVPAGTIAGSGQFIAVMTSPDRSDSVIETADRCLSKQFAVITSQDLCREILAQVNGVAVTQFAAPVTMTFVYQDADNDGMVDGTTFRETRLVVARLDDVKNEWVALPTRVDAVANTVSVTTDRLKIFTILGVQGAGTMDDAVCYPNPCRLPQDGYVRISGIPNDSTEATVMLYTLTGTLVRTLREGDGITVTATDKQAAWDGTNDDGSNVASGLYLCLIKTGTGKKTEKIGIIR